ncbi:hypothetical protein B0H11DRAFT_1634461, partial [Mycena galericulata]
HPDSHLNILSATVTSPARWRTILLDGIKKNIQHSRGPIICARSQVRYRPIVAINNPMDDKSPLYQFMVAVHMP